MGMIEFEPNYGNDRVWTNISIIIFS